MCWEEVIKKLIELMCTKEYREFECEFAEHIQKGLILGYSCGEDEPKIVNGIADKVNGLSKIIGQVQINSYATFIHGNKSQVKFTYYGEETQRELGDLIYIISILYEGRKFFERFTITQFKKSEKSRWYFNRKPDKEQLYLLARFPSFTGVSGIFRDKTYDLPNYSHCLGSYGLLYSPGDFLFVSAKILDSWVRAHSTIKREDLFPPYFSDLYPCVYYPYFCERYLDEYFLILLPDFRKLWRKGFIPYHPFLKLPILGNSLLTNGVVDFAGDYLRALIGEIVFAYPEYYNEQAFKFLQELMMLIKARGKKDAKLSQLAKAFFEYPYAGDRGGQGGEVNEEIAYEEDGGIGVIYTVINLGE